MSLYQKIRPKSLNYLIGNESTIKSLKKVLKSPDRPHTYLFCGEQGTGKTTTARIMAKDLGCSNIDCLELNGSDNRGIDDAREAISIANTAPMGGKCRVIIYDEAHKLTNEAQNALLKVLEDTPESTYFILCSTDPDKLLKTVRSRCSTYRFELLNEDQMSELLSTALETLEKEIEDDNVFFGIIDSAGGSPRNALVILEQLLSVNKPEEQKALLKKLLVEHDVIEICRLLVRGGSWKSIAEIYKGIKDVDAEIIRRTILGYMKQVMLNEKDTDRVSIASDIIHALSKNTFDSGEPHLVAMLYDATIKL